jgi:hypothetical protein
MASSTPTKAQMESFKSKLLSIVDYCQNIESKTSQSQRQYNSLHISEHREHIFYKLCLYNRFGIISGLNEDSIMTLFELSNAFYNKNINFFKDLIEKADILLSSKKEHPGIRKFENPEDLDKWINLIANSVRTTYSSNLKTSNKEPNRKLQNSFLSEADDIGYLTLSELKDKINEENKPKAEEAKPKKEEAKPKPKSEEVKPKKEKTTDTKAKTEEVKPKKEKAVSKK